MKLAYSVGLILAGLIVLAIISYGLMHGSWILLLPTGIFLGLLTLPLLSKTFKPLYALPLALFLLTPAMFMIYNWSMSLLAKVWISEIEVKDIEENLIFYENLAVAIRLSYTVIYPGSLFFFQFTPEHAEVTPKTNATNFCYREGGHCWYTSLAKIISTPPIKLYNGYRFVSYITSPTFQIPRSSMSQNPSGYHLVNGKPEFCHSLQFSDMIFDSKPQGLKFTIEHFEVAFQKSLFPRQILRQAATIPYKGRSEITGSDLASFVAAAGTCKPEHAVLMYLNEP